MEWIYSFILQFNLIWCSTEVRFFFFSCLHLSNKKGTPRGKIWKEKLLRREVTSFNHFVLIHSKPFDETDKDFIAQHMYCIHYTRLRTSRRATDFDMPFICNTHVFEFILSIQSPWIKRGFILYPEKVNFLGLRLYMHLHMRLRMKMNALHSMRMNYQ
jgi:hypothetical protein